MTMRVITKTDLLSLDVNTVISGPDWHGEIYIKTGPDEFVSVDGGEPWNSFNLESRGSFEILAGIDDFTVEDYMRISDWAEENQ